MLTGATCKAGGELHHHKPQPPPQAEWGPSQAGVKSVTSGVKSNRDIERKHQQEMNMRSHTYQTQSEVNTMQHDIYKVD